MRFLLILCALLGVGAAAASAATEGTDLINSLTAQLAEPLFSTPETTTAVPSHETPTTAPQKKSRKTRAKKEKTKRKLLYHELSDDIPTPKRVLTEFTTSGIHSAAAKLIADQEASNFELLEGYQEEDAGLAEQLNNIRSQPLWRTLGKGPAVDPNAGLYVKQIPRPPIDILLEEPDLTMLAEAMKKSPLIMSDGIRKVAATIFAPVDSVFESLPVDFGELQDMDNIPNIMDIATNIFEFHIVAPRLLTPTMLMGVTTHSTRFSGHTLQIKREEKSSEIGNATLTVEGYAQVVEIIQAKRGWIYKIDAVLGPRLNEGPTILEFLDSAKWMTRMHYLVRKSEILTEKVSRLGPLTILAVPDNGWTIRGMTVPGCLYQTLTRPENKHILTRLVKWFIIPGLWSYEALSEVAYLPAVQPPQIAVAHLRPELKHPSFTEAEDTGSSDTAAELPLRRRRRLEQLTEFRAMLGGDCPRERRELSSFTDYSPATFPPPKPEEFGISEMPDLVAKKKERFVNQTVINLLENQEIIGSYNIYNGYLHVLSSLPDTSFVFDPFLTLWDCTHQWCYECPEAAHWLLDFFDSGGLLPTGVPLEYVVPPGPRPDWVCKGTSSWFPPGWSKKTWDRYMDAVRQKRGSAAKLQSQGAQAAAEKLLDLNYRLADARVKLQRIHLFSHLETQDLRPLWDPQTLISVVSSQHMSDTLLPSCKAKDDRQHITMDDLEYIARWARCSNCAGAKRSRDK